MAAHFESLPLPLSADSGLVPPGALTRLGVGRISAGAISQDRSLLALATHAGLFVYETNTLKPRWGVPASSIVDTVAWSSDGKYVAALVSQERTIPVWNALGGSEAMRLELPTPIDFIRWSQHGHRLAIAWGGGVDVLSSGEYIYPAAVTVWDIDNRSHTQIITVPSTDKYFIRPPIRGMAWSPDELTVALMVEMTYLDDQGEVNFQPEGVSIWDAESGMMRCVASTSTWFEPLKLMAFSPDSKLLATYTGLSEGDSPTGDNRTFVWDVSTCDLVRQIDNRAVAIDAQWSADGGSLATLSQWYTEISQAIVTDIAGLDKPREINADPDIAYKSLDWSSDAKSIAISGGKFSGENWLTVWDVTTGQKQVYKDTTSNYGRSVFWLPGDEELITISDDFVTLWNRDGAIKGRVGGNINPYEGYTDIDWSPNGDSLAIVGHGIALWNTTTWNPERLAIDPHANPRVRWSPDGSKVAAFGYVATEYDVAAGAELPHPVLGSDDFAWSGDGSQIATTYQGVNDGTLTILDAASHAVLAEYETPQGVCCAAWIPYVHQVVFGGKTGIVKIFDTQSRKIIAEMDDRAEHETGIIRVSPDGRLVAIISDWRDGDPCGSVYQLAPFLTDLTIRRLDTGAIVAHREGVRGRFTTMAWSPDGLRLAVGLSHPLSLCLFENWQEDADGNPVLVWNLNAIDETPDRLVGHNGPVNGLAWSPDGSRLASASADGTVIIWQVK